VANISNTSSFPSDIQRILDHSGDLFDRSIFLLEQSKSENANLQHLIEKSLLLLEESNRLYEWKLTVAAVIE